MTSQTAVVIVTSCGKRKSRDPHPQLRAGSLRRADAARMAAEWRARLAAAEPKIPARHLYQGRAFREAEAAAASVGGHVYVVSAGLGLVCADERVPPYSLTVSPRSADSILNLLPEPSRETAATWWKRLGEAEAGASFESLFATPNRLVLIAAGGAYLAMIAAELESLPDEALARLRLFTAAPPAHLPPRLQSVAMPYDRRLEALGAGRAGTLADFAQRALRHFAEEILPAWPKASAIVHAKAVGGALEGLAAPERKRGRSASDETILALIRSHRQRLGSGAMHRLLRHGLGIACEQQRFRKLWAAAAAEPVAE